MTFSQFCLVAWLPNAALQYFFFCCQWKFSFPDICFILCLCEECVKLYAGFFSVACAKRQILTSSSSFIHTKPNNITVENMKMHFLKNGKSFSSLNLFIFTLSTIFLLPPSSFHSLAQQASTASSSGHTRCVFCWLHQYKLLECALKVFKHCKMWANKGH